MHTTSPTLLERLRQPTDRAAWDRFVHLYARLLYHWAYAAGIPDAEAADLVQDVFLLLLRKLPEFQYDPKQKFRAWLRTVVLNKWRDQLRRKVARPDEKYADDLDELAQPLNGDAFEETEYRRHLLYQALDLIRPEFQESTWRAFIEHGLRNRPAATVAAELGMSIGAVYAAKFRVMNRLRTELDGFLE